MRGEEVIKEQCKQPVGRHGEHGPLIDLLRHVDVLLTRDGDLLGLVLEELDVIVHVEDAVVELGEVVELRRKWEVFKHGCIRSCGTKQKHRWRESAPPSPPS